MPKFVFFFGHYSNTPLRWGPVARFFDVDGIEAIVDRGDDREARVVLSGEQNYVFVTVPPGSTTLKDELIKLGASFLTNDSRTPIPAAQLKYVFLEAVNSIGEHAWVNLAKVRGVSDSAFKPYDEVFGLIVGSEVYGTTTNVRDILRATGAGVVIDVDL